MPDKKPNLEWLEEFEHLAERILGQTTSTATRDIHTYIKQWYEETMLGDFPSAPENVMQALTYLTNEILYDMPESIFKVVAPALDEDEVAVWLLEILILGRAFERAFQAGHFDNLEE